MIHPRVEDALFLLSWGEYPERIATRLGTTLAGLDILFRRHGLNGTVFKTASETQRRKR